MFAVEALSRNRALKTLQVVTSPKFGSRRAEFEDHYAAIFSNPKLRNKLRFKYTAFDDWVKEGVPL